MIISRYNLMAHKMSRQDRGIPMLDNVHFEKDGTSIATNGLAVIVVSPVTDKMKEHVIIQDKDTIKSDITISAESVKEALKSLPRDTKYAGVLEHCVIEKKTKDKTVIKFSDGKRSKSLEAKVYNNEYADYRSFIKNSYKNNKTNIKTAFNLSRLLSVLSTINEICPDTSYSTPVFIEFNEDGNLIFRCTNMKNSQQVIGLVRAYDGLEGKIPDLTEWEKRILHCPESSKPKPKIKKIRKTKIKDKDDIIIFRKSKKGEIKKKKFIRKMKNRFNRKLRTNGKEKKE